MVVLSVKERAARCRLLTSDRVITLRAGGLWDVVPGEIVVVNPHKQWNYAGHPYLSGEIESPRLDVDALGLAPLRLEDQGIWDPRDEYWGEEGDPIEAWAAQIIARGPRPAFEMEQVLPGADPDDPDSDPIIDSNDLKQAGDNKAAYRILMELCRAISAAWTPMPISATSRSITVHRRPSATTRSACASASSRSAITSTACCRGGTYDNRPFLRCMHGFGLCLWRLGRFEEAGTVFERMLWLNPSDNQGVRFLIAKVRAGMAWEERRERG